jgi:hypothetical protein
MRTSGEVTVHVDGPAEAVYDLVADVTRIGEFSPECRRAEWLGDACEAAPGARFRGRNVGSKLARWSRVCEVVTAEPGREFSFRTVPTLTYPDSTVWSYRFEPAGDGTDVTESYEVVKLPPRLVLALYVRLLPHHMDMRPHLRRTLEAIKRTVEAGTARPTPLVAGTTTTPSRRARRATTAELGDRSSGASTAGYAAFSQTETWLLLSLVKGSRFQSLHRSRNVRPASRAMRSSSEGQT